MANHDSFPAAEARVAQHQEFSGIVGELLSEGEQLLPSLTDGIGSDPTLINWLEQSNTSIKEYLRHSNRFAFLDRERLFDRSQPVVIPESSNNLTQLGNLRPEETGYRLDMDFVRASGIDPAKVLYFRATQPGGPKPEYYWTSDINEAKRELREELGVQAAAAAVLVSSLEDISCNGGLMNDINDDGGVAVRQIGLDNFNQNDALLVLGRSTVGWLQNSSRPVK
jgi:hypothetical protein